ncbi:Ca-activated chloride channel family protein [Singulisphaera sp. GP187]|nr:Ca-activated chloride channel family protein [Singulisphaera sp. GP187]
MEVFAQPQSLWLLVALPLLFAWVVRGLLRRRRDWVLLGQGSRLRRDGSLGWLAAIFCLILAVAQPRWGRGAIPPLSPGHDIVFLVDTSRSMGAEDAVPNRLGVAIETAESLIQALGEDPGNRAAVVAFAGRGRLRCPLTENLGAAAESLRELRPGDVQPGGTDLGAGLEVAIDAFGDQERAEGRTIILFSDGEDHAGTWTASLEDLRLAGIVVHSIAIGDPAQGHAVPSGRGSASLTYRGSPVLSKREDRAFESLAHETGGAFLPLGLAAVDLGPLFQNRIAPVARQKRDAIRPSEKSERFPIFVATALVLGLWGSWPSRGRWLRSRRWILLLGLLAPLLGAGGTAIRPPLGSRTAVPRMPRASMARRSLHLNVRSRSTLVRPCLGITPPRPCIASSAIPTRSCGTVKLVNGRMPHSGPKSTMPWAIRRSPWAI